MESEKKRGGWWALAGMIGVPMLLLAGYIGAYQALMWRLQGTDFYEVGFKWQPEARAFFRPINQIDRWLRPEIWEKPGGSFVSEWSEPRLDPTWSVDSSLR